MLSTNNLRLHGTQKFYDHIVGSFVVLEHIGNTVYHLDLPLCTALRGVFNVFHVLLLHDWLSSRVNVDVPPIQIDVEAEYKIA